MSSEMIEAERAISRGALNPFDAEDDAAAAPPPRDWAHAAARGVIADLMDRKGIKHGFGQIDHEIRVEIVDSLGAIIRAAGRAPLRELLKKATRVADRLEGERVPIPCPDGIRGCLVAHFRIKSGPIAMAIRALGEEHEVCPICGGDCASANPPVINCPALAAGAP